MGRTGTHNNNKYCTYEKQNWGKKLQSTFCTFENIFSSSRRKSAKCICSFFTPTSNMKNIFLLSDIKAYHGNLITVVKVDKCVEKILRPFVCLYKTKH